MNSQDPDRRPPGDATDPARSRALFEHAVERLDTSAGNQLRLMRRDALASASTMRFGTLAWTGAGAMAAVLLGLAWWLPRTTGPAPAAAPVVAESTDAVLPLEDDAELYAWLGDAPVAVDPPGGSL